MGTTANYGFPYPDSTDPPEVWTDMEALADAVDASLDSLADVVAAAKTWTTFTPIFVNNQGGGTVSNIAKTVTRAGYARIAGTGAGSIILAQCEIVASAAAAGGAGLGLPVTAIDRWFLMGVAGIYGVSPPAGQTGHAYMGSALDRINFINYNGAFLDVAAGQTVRYMVLYRAAA